MLAMVQAGRALPSHVSVGKLACCEDEEGEHTSHEIGDVDCTGHAAGIGVGQGARVVEGVAERVGEDDDDAARRAGAGAGYVGGEAVDGLLGAGEDGIFDNATGEAVSTEACGHYGLELAMLWLVLRGEVASATRRRCVQPSWRSTPRDAETWIWGEP